MNTYVDIDFSFKMHPITGDISLKKDNSAIQQSIKNLVQTSYLERGFNVLVGSNILSNLFENLSSIVNHRLTTEIRNLLKNFEPRVEVADVKIFEQGSNTLIVNVSYYIVNSHTIISFNFPLERLR